MYWLKPPIKFWRAPHVLNTCGKPCLLEMISLNWTLPITSHIYCTFYTMLYSFVEVFFYFHYFIFSQFYGLFRTIKMQIHKDFRSVFTSMAETFPSCRDVKSAMRQGNKHGYKSERFLLHMVNHLFFIVRTTTNHHSNSILVHFVGWLFLALQTLANQWLPNYHKNIFSNILSLDSFFSQHRPLDILWGRLRYILTP